MSLEKNKNFFANWFSLYMTIKISLHLLIFYYFQIFYLVFFFAMLLILTFIDIFFIFKYKNRLSLEELMLFNITPFAIIVVLIGNVFFQNQVPSFYMWVVAVIFVSVLLKKRNYYRLIILVLILTIVAPMLSEQFGISAFMNQEFKKLDAKSIKLLNYLEIFFQIIGFTLISSNLQMHFQYIFQNSKPENQEFSDSIDNENLKKDDYLKFQFLYNRIIQIFENEKPYLNPEYKLMDLAKQIGSNRSYTSIALNKNGLNFNKLLNYYRIRDAKRMILEGNNPEQFFSEIGFRYFNTFTRVFFEIEGIEVSDFTKNLKTKIEKPLKHDDGNGEIL